MFQVITKVLDGVGHGPVHPIKFYTKLREPFLFYVALCKEGIARLQQERVKHSGYKAKTTELSAFKNSSYHLLSPSELK